MSARINISRPSNDSVAIVTDDYTAALLVDLLDMIDLDSVSGHPDATDLHITRRRMLDGLRSVSV